LTDPFKEKLLYEVKFVQKYDYHISKFYFNVKVIDSFEVTRIEIKIKILFEIDRVQLGHKIFDLFLPTIILTLLILKLEAHISSIVQHEIKNELEIPFLFTF
jgi:hypothetical protein